MVQKVQIKRTSTPNLPPTGLQPGELAVEMDRPTRLWGGVPTAQDATLKKLLIDTTNQHEHGRCRLRLVGANLVLQPYNGNKLMINGRTEVIPDAGVSLAPAGAVANAIAYVYAYMAGAVMTLELAAGAHSRDAASGVQIKTGDVTRTLVGMVYPEAGPVFTDTPRKRYVRSWFNDQGVTTFCDLPAGVTTTSLTPVILSANWNVRLLVWDNEVCRIINAGSMSTSALSAYVLSDLSVLYNGVALAGLAGFVNVARYGGTFWLPYAVVLDRADPADKLVEVHPTGFITGTGTGYWGVHTPNLLACSVNATTKGRR